MLFRLERAHWAYLDEVQPRRPAELPRLGLLAFARAAFRRAPGGRLAAAAGRAEARALLTHLSRAKARQQRSCCLRDLC